MFSCECTSSREKKTFTKAVIRVSRYIVSCGANAMLSHTIYKIRANDGLVLLLKTRIAPLDNEGSIKAEIKLECCMCSLVEAHVILLVASLHKWCIVKLDVKPTFLQIGRAQHDMYVITPREFEHKNELWLLLVAAYRLVSSNGKWQV